LPERRTRVGGNIIIQRLFLGASTTASITQSQEDDGYALAVTQLEPPFRHVLMRRQRARRIKTPIAVVTSPDFEKTIPETFSLEWDALGEFETFGDAPEKILRS
jgi:hypothetical protein